MIQPPPNARVSIPFQLSSKAPQSSLQYPVLSLKAVDAFSTQPQTGLQLRHGTPFTLSQAQTYIQQQWNILNLGMVPPPQVILIKEGDTPAYTEYQVVPFEEWKTMQPTLRPSMPLKWKLDGQGKPGIELQNVILMPQEALSKGRFGILAHELNHATVYPKRVAAIMAGQLPPASGEQIPPQYLEQVWRAGFNQNPDMIHEGIYRAKLYADSGVYGLALVQLNQKLEQKESTGQKDFEYLKLLADYKEAFAKYFSSPEELQGFLIYGNLKGDPAMNIIFKTLFAALNTRNKPLFSSAVDQLCAYGVSEGHLKGRNLPSLPNHVIEGIFDEWDQNLQLLTNLNR